MRDFEQWPGSLRFVTVLLAIAASPLIVVVMFVWWVGTIVIDLSSFLAAKLIGRR